MKRIFLIILLVAITLSGMAQTIGEAFYIYRNDGQFNAFFRDEVQGIEYSYYDADSIKYEEIVTQVVITADSVYKIPLAAIDSVGFVQPETIYKEDAVQLTGSLFDYLHSASGMTLSFSSALPDNLTPQVGDKIVTMELTDKLPYGFVGKVKQVSTGSSGIDVLCDSIEIEEVVEKFYGVVLMGDKSGSNANSLWRAPSYYYRDYDLPNTPINIPIDISAYITEKNIFDINGKADINVNIVPSTAVRVTLVVDGIRSHTQVHMASRLVTTTTIDICGEASKDLKLNLLPNDGNYKGPWGIPLYFAIGPKLEFSGEILAEFKVGITIDVTSDITYYPQTLIPTLSILGPIVNRVEGTVNVSNFNVTFDRVGARGSLRTGVFSRFGVSTGDHKKAWMGLEADGGGKCDVDFLFDIARLREADRSTTLYDELKSLCNLEVKPFFGVHFMASADDDHYTFKLGPEFDDFGSPLFKGGLVPTFSDTRLTHSANGALSADATTNILGACPIPYTVGYSLFDSENNRVGEPQYYDEKYSVFNSFASYSGTFDNLKSNETYTVYPTISLFGYPMLASPSAELDTKFPVTISDFKVTESQYKENGFTHEGVNYDYRFDVSVTATLDEDAEGIADWGYVYLDPKGNEAFISLKQFGYSYSDTRYAYFRNENPSTCTLYGYVKYVGSNEPVYGEPYDYPLEYESTITVHTLSASNIGESSATIAGKVEGYTEGLDDGEVGFYYNTTDNPSQGNGQGVSAGRLSSISDGDFQATLSNLQQDKTYYYRTYYYSDGEYTYGETRSFKTNKSGGTGVTSCPNGNHPHWIDLGIGTEWRCCNVGASSPEEYGDYYTFEQAQAYNPPSLEQFEALLYNCSSTWTTQNGVNGQKFTGPNGGTIFLPATGNRDNNGHLFGVGECGRYWSSTRLSEPEFEGYVVNFGFGRSHRPWWGGGWDYDIVYSVRPVR